MPFIAEDYSAMSILTVNQCLLSAISRHWLTVNVTSIPPHLGASRAYLEDVTAAEFCEEGGHGLEGADLVKQRPKAGLF